MPCSRRVGFAGAQYNGGVAQLGERVNGIHEVRGSIPLASIGKQDGKVREVGGGSGGSGRSGRSGRLGGMVGGPTERLNCSARAGIAQLVEHNLAKVGVAGSSPVSRSGDCGLRIADCEAGLAEAPWCRLGRPMRNPKLTIRNRNDAGWSSLVARRAHNPEVVGSNPTPAIL